MFCANCGQNLPEGKDFCTNCSAPVGEAAAATLSVASTPEGGPVPGSTSVPGGSSAPTGMPAPAGLPAKPKRTGLIAGVVLAAIVVLAAAGVGIWLALRGDDGSGQTAAGGGPVTTAVIAADEGSPDGDASGVTGSLDPTVAAYRTAVENILRELDFDHGRIPELADIINANLPDTPQPVYDELRMMADRLGPAWAALQAVAVPAGYEEPNVYLLDAALHMANRIQATIDGIERAWDADATGPALPSFAEGRNQRDAYLDAIGEYYNIIPPGYLPGDPGICDT